MTCDRCGTELEIGMYPFCKGNPAGHGTIYAKSTAFPFEARHVHPDGKPMVIESMQHLRKVERELGVAFSAFHNSVNNSIDPLKGELPKYRGEDPDVRRKYQR